MIYKFYQLLWQLKGKDFIPKLPRGMLATEYAEEDVTPDEWRVLARIGARDRHGIKRAMRKYNVTTIPDLIEYLEHHQPKRQPGRRLQTIIGRLIGGYSYHPHEAAIKRAWKQQQNNQKCIEIQERVKHAKKHYAE